MAAIKICSSLLVTATIVMIAFSPTVTGQTSVQCYNTLNNVTQTITSQGYPLSNYPNNADCQWSISAQVPTQVIVLTLVYFSLETASSTCAYDYVTVNDGAIYSIFSNTTYITNQIKKICGLVPASKFISNGPIMIITFHSDSSTNAAGFKFEYSAHNRSELCGITSLSASYGYTKNLISPGYPNAYTSNLDCQWTIRSDISSYVIVLNLLDLTLEGIRYDNLTIYDGPSSSSSVIQTLGNTVTASQFISTGPSMTLVFQTDASGNYKGFSLQYKSQEKSAVCTGGTLTANWGINYLSSPNFPGAYPMNLDCRWQIQAGSSSDVVVLEVDQFGVEGSGAPCYSDYVTIYDGPTIYSSKLATLCGYKYSGTYTSTGSDMTVTFHSNGVNSYNTGFKFTYKSGSKSTDYSYYSYSSGLSSGAIAGIVICSIGVPFLVVVFVVVLIKRNASQRQARTRVPVQNGGVTAVPAVSYVANNQQAYPNQYATVQNPQGVNMGAPGYNTSYYPPPYQYNMPPASAPQGQTPILNNPGPGPSMGVAPTHGDEGHFNKGFIS